jgi:hypothetical protein
MALGGLVHLTALATAPSPIVTVEYLLDGTSMVSLSEPPYRFDWDTSTADAGDHTLAVRATDSAGNQGTSEVLVTVGPPIVAAVSVSQTQVKPGQEISAEALASSIADLAYVEFLIDGRPAGTVDAPPYRITVDTTGFADGTHTITARAVDKLGRTSEARIEVRVQAPPPPMPTATATATPMPAIRIVYEQGWPIGTVALIVLVAGVLTGLVFSAQRKRRRVVLQLTVHNEGNTGDSYELWAEAPRGIRARFARNGIPLTRRKVVLIEEQTGSTPESTPASAPARSPGRGGDVGEKARGLAGLVSSMAYGLSSVLRFLPASMREPMQQGLSQFYRGRSRVQSASISASRLSRAAGRVAPAGAAGRAAAGDTPAPVARPVAEPKGQVTHTSQAIRTIALPGYQTPLVAPGEQSAMEVLVDPTRQHYRSKDYVLEVLSRSINQESAPTVIAQRSVQMRGISLIRRVFPFLLVYGFAVLSLFILQRVLTTAL